MNLKAIAQTVLPFAATLFIISCQKNNDQPAPKPIPATKQLVKVKTNDNDSTTLSYTASGKLSKIETTEEDEDLGRINYTFTYAPGDQLNEITTNVGIRYRHVYESNRVKMAEQFFGTNKLSETQFEFTNGKITTSTVFSAIPQGAGVIKYLPTFKTTYAYDGNGQLVKSTSFSIEPATGVATKIGERQILQLDNSKNPLSVVEPLMLVTVYDQIGEHNVLKEVTLDADGNTETSTTNSYVYDADKYPVSGTSIETPADGVPETTQLKYFYK